jgi:hypothetical protein
MKRILLVAASAMATALSMAAPAGAVSGQIIHSHFNGNFAEASWGSSTTTADTSTYLRVSQSNRGSQLLAEQFVVTYDAQHNVTGAADTLVDAPAGFNFTIDANKLTTAAVTATELPATICTYDASFNQTGCAGTALDLSVTWTGQGPITRNTNNSRVSVPGFSITDHLNGINRDGTADGNMGSTALGTSDFAILGKAVSGSTTLCVGGHC